MASSKLAGFGKKSALPNVPRGGDKDTQKFLDEARSEIIRVSGMAAAALDAIGKLPKAAAATTVAAATGSGTLKPIGSWNFEGGLQVRWGRIPKITNGQRLQVEFAEKFSNECFIVLAGGTSRIAGNAQDNAVDAYTATEPTTSGFIVTSSIDAPTIGHYLAIGR